MFAKKHLGVLAVSILISAVAAAEPAANRGRAAQLEGTWVVTVDLHNPPPFLPETFSALETYSRGGGLVTGNDMQQGPGQGSWEKDGDEYAVSILFFVRDADNATTGSIRVRHRVTLDGADSYTGTGEADLFDAAGVPLGTVPFTTIGQRLAAQ